MTLTRSGKLIPKLSPCPKGFQRAVSVRSRPTRMRINPIQKTIRLCAAILVCVWKVVVAGQVIEEVHAFEWPQGNPSGGLVEASDGNFYGVTPVGGPGADGTIFRVTPSGTLTM